MKEFITDRDLYTNYDINKLMGVPKYSKSEGPKDYEFVKFCLSRDNNPRVKKLDIVDFKSLHDYNKDIFRVHYLALMKSWNNKKNKNPKLKLDVEFLQPLEILTEKNEHENTDFSPIKKIIETSNHETMTDETTIEVASFDIGELGSEFEIASKGTPRNRYIKSKVLENRFKICSIKEKNQETLNWIAHYLQVLKSNIDDLESYLKLHPESD
jgi:hypothetical protein